MKNMKKISNNLMIVVLKKIIRGPKQVVIHNLKINYFKFKKILKISIKLIAIN
jgi:hypothetical protein